MLARRNPFRDLLRMRTEMDRMFEDAFQVPSWEWEPGSAALDLDVSEKDDEFLVKASIPGINPDDLDITLNDRTLTIKGEMKAEEESKNEHYHLRERRYGSFSRSITLPTAAQPDAVEANYDRGVLSLRIPKAEEVKPKRIAIHGSQKVIEGKSTNGQK